MGLEDTNHFKWVCQLSCRLKQIKGSLKESELTTTRCLMTYEVWAPKKQTVIFKYMYILALWQFYFLTMTSSLPSLKHAMFQNWKKGGNIIHWNLTLLRCLPIENLVLLNFLYSDYSCSVAHTHTFMPEKRLRWYIHHHHHQILSTALRPGCWQKFMVKHPKWGHNLTSHTWEISQRNWKNIPRYVVVN